jgi:hypothetical protein
VPIIEGIEYAVYEILLLARLAEHCPALIVKSRDDLLKSVDGVMSYTDLESLWDNSQGGTMYKRMEEYIEVAPGINGGHGRVRKGRSEH